MNPGRGFKGKPSSQCPSFAVGSSVWILSMLDKNSTLHWLHLTTDFGSLLLLYPCPHANGDTASPIPFASLLLFFHPEGQ